MSTVATSTPDDFQNALDGWKENGRTQAIGNLPIYWWGAEPTVLAYSREHRGKLHDQEIEEIRKLIASLDLEYAWGPGGRAENLLNGSDDLQHASRQMVTLVQGMLHGLLAAHFTLGWQPTSGKPLADEVICALESCLSKYHEAWDLRTRAIKAPVNAAGSHSQPDGSVAILDQFGQQVGPSADWWNESNWLLVRRLLSYLHGDVDGSLTGPENHVQALLVVEDDEKSFRGRPLPIIVAERDEGRNSAYLDPVALGITPLDDQLRTSLQVAARICWSRLESKPGEKSRSLRIGMDPHQCGVKALEGASAGGLVTAAAYATASRRRLNRDCTASFTVGVVDHDWMQDREHVLLESQVVLGPVSPESLYAKFTCVREVLHMKAVFLHGSQELGFQEPGAWNSNPTRLKWSDWAARLERELHIHIEPIGRTSESEADSNPSARTLADVIEAMTGDELIEACIATLAQKAIADWELMRRGRFQPDANENHHLDLFIPPAISVAIRHEDLPKPPGTVPSWAVIKKSKSKSENEPTQRIRANRYFRIKNGVHGLLNQFLLNQNRPIVVTEDAGAGKTVLSWWMRSLLSQGLSSDPQKPFLVVRYEGIAPEDPRRELEGFIAESAKHHRLAPETVIESLLEQRRIVVILDALDQASDEDLARLERSSRLGSTADWSRFRWVATSRSHTIAEHPFLNSWQKARLDLFGPKRRNKFKQAVVADDVRFESLWNQLVPDESEVADLIRFPLVLQHLRQLVQDAARNGRQLDPIRNRGDLYWRISHLLIERAFKRTERKRFPGDVACLMEATACFGIQMMLQTREQYQFRVPNGLVREVTRHARALFGGTDQEWNLCLELLRDTHFTDRSLLLAETGGSPELSFRSVKMLEFAAGTYLAQFADSKVHDPLAEHIGDPKWYWPFRFAIELPLMPQNRRASPAYRIEALAGSIGCLFLEPEGRPRPTELMYRAQQLFQELKGKAASQAWQKILKAYRQQFLDILAGNDQDRARLAAELLLEQDVRHLVDQGKTGSWKFEDLRPNAKDYPAYSLCCDPDNSQRLSFMMGASPEDSVARETEKPWQPVEINSFYMGTACVTRAQYKLFDPITEKLHTRGGYPIAKNAPEPDCPMIYVSFFDAACFALWLGDRYRLPTEVQWEGAAWGGIDRTSPEHSQTVIGVEPYDRSFTSSQVNFNGNYPLSGEKSDYLQQTLPVRWDSARREELLQKYAGDGFPNAYSPNGMKLWQMSGNVSEWCNMQWFNKLADAIQHRDHGIDIIHDVCVRGGSWVLLARFCRCSFRGRFAPGDRDFNFGFRLLRTSS